MKDIALMPPTEPSPLDVHGYTKWDGTLPRRTRMSDLTPEEIAWIRTNLHLYVDAEEIGRLLAAYERVVEELKVANQIGDTFWEALKPLNLQAINVANPGSHVSDVIADRTRLVLLNAVLTAQVTEVEGHLAMVKRE